MHSHERSNSVCFHSNMSRNSNSALLTQVQQHTTSTSLTHTTDTLMGRRKIAIKRIDNCKRAHSTFSKRKRGFFKKMDDLSFLTGANVCCIMQTPANNYFWHTVGNKQPNMEEMIPVIIKSIDQKAGKESHFFQNKRNKKNFKWTKEMKSKLQTTGSLAADSSAMPDGPFSRAIDMHQYQQYLSNYLAMHGVAPPPAPGYPYGGAAPMMYANMLPHPNAMCTGVPQQQAAPSVSQQSMSGPHQPQSEYHNSDSQSHYQHAANKPQITINTSRNHVKQEPSSESNSTPSQYLSNSSTSTSISQSQPHNTTHRHAHHQHHSRGTSSTQKMRICTNLVPRTTGKRVSFGESSAAIDSGKHAHDASTPFLSPPALSVTPSLSPGNLSAVRLATPPTALLMGPIDIVTPKHGVAHSSGHQSKSFLSPLSSSSKYPSPLVSPVRGLRHKHRTPSNMDLSYSDIETPRFAKAMPWLNNTIPSDSDFPLGDDIFASAATEHFSCLDE
mmetsp:Transcript_9489/g.35204  ORF Transcript_9489/g.35204 Transcript_9489/m.35204 type:complete len:499 (-) Transcript_9489:59-1555(-)